MSEASKILQQRELSYEHLHASSVEKIFEVANESLVFKFQRIQHVMALNR